MEASKLSMLVDATVHKPCFQYVSSIYKKPLQVSAIESSSYSAKFSVIQYHVHPYPQLTFIVKDIVSSIEMYLDNQRIIFRIIFVNVIFSWLSTFIG